MPILTSFHPFLVGASWTVFTAFEPISRATTSVFLKNGNSIVFLSFIIQAGQTGIKFMSCPNVSIPDGNTRGRIHVFNTCPRNLSKSLIGNWIPASPFIPLYEGDRGRRESQM